MTCNQDPDTPSGLVSPPPGGEPVIKDEPEDAESSSDTPEIVVEDCDSEGIEDDEDAMRELIANPYEVLY